MESNYDIAIKEIYIPSKHAKESYLCEDFIIFPEGKEKNGGYVFGIIELRATPTAESEKIIQTIVNTLKENYYNQILSSPEPQKLNLETVFEYALQKTNDSITEMIQIGHVKLALENLNYLVAVAKPNQATKEIDFFFTQQGLISAYLLHKTRENNYKVINIIENTPKLKEADAGRIKIFSSTLAGKIFAHDAVYVSSEIFSNYIPAHKVNKILSTNEMPSAIDYFKSLINSVKNNSHLTYCAIFVKMEAMRPADNRPIAQKSIDALIDTQDRTEKFLTPTFALNLKDYFGKIAKLFKRGDSGKKLTAPKTQPKVKFGIVKFIFNAVKIIFTSLGRICLGAVLFLSGQKKENPTRGSLADKKKLNAVNKTILAIVAGLVVCLVGSVFLVKYLQNVKAEKTAYENQLKKIRDEIDNAQLNLIYKNNDNSAILAQKAAEDISALPQKTASQKANYSDLGNQLQSIREKLLNIVKIEPRQIAEISENSRPAMLRSILNLDNKSYVAADSANLYIVASDGKVAKTTTNESGAILWSAKEDANLLFLTDEGKLLKFDANSNSLLPQSIDLAGAGVSAMSLYNQSLYFLDSARGELLKARPGAAGFGSGQAWIKNRKGADLSQAIGLALDGNIYVLTSAGKIYKFYAGNLVDFNLSPVDPPISDARKIVAGLDLNYIYILDKAGKRIVAIDKTGKFAKQFSFDSLLGGIADFQVDEKSNVISFIAGNKVYQANIK
ncbi:MAG: hypothetical protein V1928_05375 [Parcubacteria group bacterium]